MPLELSLEVHRLIIKHAANRHDIVSLCRVCRSFRFAAQRALYNTLFIGNNAQSELLCRTLLAQPRLASLIEALTISLSDTDPDEDPESLPPDFWQRISQTLQIAHRLRHLNIYINDGSDNSVSWILRNCPFQLYTLHCELLWDDHLHSFLQAQHRLTDLYIIDYHPTSLTPRPTLPTPSDIALCSGRCVHRLTVLECSFSEAVAAFVPHRPIRRVKTAISNEDESAKTTEVSTLFFNLQLSACHLESLDISDSSYTESSFTMAVLSHASSEPSTCLDLKYLGTLVLPVDGQERLCFYGLLKRFPSLECVELEVTPWQLPQPSTIAIFRTLCGECHLYCPNVTTFILVDNFERTVVRFIYNTWYIDEDISADTLWREV